MNTVQAFGTHGHNLRAGQSCLGGGGGGGSDGAMVLGKFQVPGRPTNLD